MSASRIPDQTSTPGPWRAVQDEYGREHGEGWWVELPNQDQSHNPGWYETGEGQLSEADAHLIAAAPDLYAALKKLADAVDEMGDPNEAAYLWPTVEEARAALKKATER